MAGGIAGVAAARAWGLQVARAPVDWAVIALAGWVPPVPAADIEAGATFVQLLLLFAVLGSSRHHRWAFLVAGVTPTAFIVAVGRAPVRPARCPVRRGTPLD